MSAAQRFAFSLAGMVLSIVMAVVMAANGQTVSTAVFVVLVASNAFFVGMQVGASDRRGS